MAAASCQCALITRIPRGLGKPVREPLVELRSLFLRHRLVRGVPDQEVPEPERILTGERRPVRASATISDTHIRELSG